MVEHTKNFKVLYLCIRLAVTPYKLKRRIYLSSVTDFILTIRL